MQSKKTRNVYESSSLRVFTRIEASYSYIFFLMIDDGCGLKKNEEKKVEITLCRSRSLIRVIFVQIPFLCPVPSN
jgi:hypothetical protein